MSHTPHELSEEFPNEANRISALKGTDPHFAKLVEEYDDVNRAVHRAETNLEPTEQLHEAELRRKRVMLKDAIWRILSKSAA